MRKVFWLVSEGLLSLMCELTWLVCPRYSDFECQKYFACVSVVTWSIVCEVFDFYIRGILTLSVGNILSCMSEVWWSCACELFFNCVRGIMILWEVFWHVCLKYPNLERVRYFDLYVQVIQILTVRGILTCVSKVYWS